MGSKGLSALGGSRAEPWPSFLPPTLARRLLQRTGDCRSGEVHVRVHRRSTLPALDSPIVVLGTDDVASAVAHALFVAGWPVVMARDGKVPVLRRAHGLRRRAGIRRARSSPACRRAAPAACSAWCNCSRPATSCRSPTFRPTTCFVSAWRAGVIDARLRRHEQQGRPAGGGRVFGRPRPRLRRRRERAPRHRDRARAAHRHHPRGPDAAGARPFRSDRRGRPRAVRPGALGRHLADPACHRRRGGGGGGGGRLRRHAAARPDGRAPARPGARRHHWCRPAPSCWKWTRAAMPASGPAYPRAPPASPR